MKRWMPLLLALALASAACGAGDASLDDGTSSADITAATIFVRSDQVHYGRAPANTIDLSADVDPARPHASAATVNAYVDAHPEEKRPIYLGCVHAWLFNDEESYRQDWITLVENVHTAPGQRLEVYFEEQNATHAPDPVAIDHGAALRTLASHAALLMATYANGRMSHLDVVHKIEGFRYWYHSTLHIPMRDLMIDIDTSQTTEAFYYGTRGDLAQFNLVVGWALDCAYNQGFAGFHTMGNSRFANWSNGTAWASETTYTTLDHAWARLEAEHPHQVFEGVR